VQSPLSSKLTDETLLTVTSRAEGTVRSLTLVNCIKITDSRLLDVVEQNPEITKVNLVYFGIFHNFVVW
jgi:hypothetical protein